MNRIVVVFQPHRYSRTQHLQEGFARALLRCGVLVVNEVYSAGEEPIDGGLQPLRTFLSKPAPRIAELLGVPELCDLAAL